MLEAEMDEHLGYEKNSVAGNNSGKIMQLYSKGKCQRDTLTISNSTGSNERTHRSEFDTLRYVQCIPT